VANSAVFGNVDVLTSEHRIAALLHANTLRKFDQRLDEIIGDSLLRHVNPEVSHPKDVTLGACRIVSKQRAQVWWLRKVGKVSEFHRSPP